MNTLPNSNFSRVRKQHHLKLKDVAYILNLDEGNLSRFESGLLQSPKALVGYHCLFDVSMDSTIKQVFDKGYQSFIDRCFQLIEIIQAKSKTVKNRLRIKTINSIIGRLTDLEEAYEAENR